MIDRTKKLPARFYETPSGRKPVRDWLLELEAGDRRIVGYDIQTVELVGQLACRFAGLLPAWRWPLGSAQSVDERQDRSRDFPHR